MNEVHFFALFPSDENAGTKLVVLVVVLALFLWAVGFPEP